MSALKNISNFNIMNIYFVYLNKSTEFCFPWNKTKEKK